MTSPYGWDHRTTRARLIKLAYGKACPLCGATMWPPDWMLDLDHKTPIALGGSGPGGRIVHAKCNRSAGARLGNLLRRRPAGSQDW